MGKPAAAWMCVLNFFGGIENVRLLRKSFTKEKACLLFVPILWPWVYCNLQGHLGADVVVGDAQPFWDAMNFGGPHCGYFAVKKRFNAPNPQVAWGKRKKDVGDLC